MCHHSHSKKLMVNIHSRFVDCSFTQMGWIAHLYSLLVLCTSFRIIWSNHQYCCISRWQQWQQGWTPFAELFDRAQCVGVECRIGQLRHSRGVRTRGTIEERRENWKTHSIYGRRSSNQSQMHITSTPGSEIFLCQRISSCFVCHRVCCSVGRWECAGGFTDAAIVRGEYLKVHLKILIVHT